MIDQSHSFGHGQAGAVTAGHEGHAEGMETGVDSAFSNEPVNAAVLVARQLAGDRFSVAFHFFEDSPERRIKWHSEEFTRVALPTFRIDQREISIDEIDVLVFNLALIETATSVRAYQDATLNPFWFLATSGKQYPQLVISDLGFDLWGCARDPKAQEGIGFRVFPADRFIQQLRHEFEFEQRRVMSHLAVMHWCGLTPAKVGIAMRVPYLTGINDPLDAEERPNGVPGDRHPTFSVPGAVRPMGTEIFGHPDDERGIVPQPSKLRFFDRGFLSNSLRLARFVGCRCAQTSGLLHPPSGVHVASPNIPKRRARVAPDGSHTTTVSHGFTRLQWLAVVFRGFPWRILGKDVTSTPTITPRGKGFHRWKLSSLTWVSQ